ncbi:GNAT family N-acetyltransferase [Cytobacillus suaedae]|nr:GNAT family N-acetyltransferase [Cytobacillus suaedae]
MIKIRHYTESDLEALTGLMTDLGYPATLEEMSKRMGLINSNPNYFTFVATLDERVVGMMGITLHITYTNDNLKTQITSLVTKKEYQGQGIGKELIKYAEVWSNSKGSDFMYLTSGISEKRVSAHEFYKHLGFEITGYRFVKQI